ncbi:MAG: Autoinducer 2-binding protein LsrB precursor [Firmicutes bacterium ADurb.Bin467]|jgi:ABC-type sugar transport system substrate-binding protein|nr:MAG: Autoinducer 2-binding protein LsrB precursor [Firmicutes bacterium ADurb.Bin467]
MKKLVALTLVLLMAFGLASVAHAESKGTIAVVCYVTSAPYFSFGEQTAIETGKALGYDVIWTGTTEVDTPGLISIIENLIAQDVDAICLASGDTTSVVPICQQAMEKGIKVVSFDLDIDPAGRDVYAGLMDLAELGIPQVESIVDSIGEEGKYAIITGVLTNELLQKRIDFCLEYAKEKYPGLECVTVEGMDEDPEKCYNVAMNIMTAYPDVKAIMSNVSTGVGPISSAIEDAGMIGKVYACGQSTPNLAKPGMESGACVSAVLWDTAKWQAWAVTIAANLIEGVEMPVGPLSIPGFEGAERLEGNVFYFYETFTFTPENINNFNF